MVNPPLPADQATSGSNVNTSLPIKHSSSKVKQHRSHPAHLRNKRVHGQHNPFSVCGRGTEMVASVARVSKKWARLRKTHARDDCIICRALQHRGSLQCADEGACQRRGPATSCGTARVACDFPRTCRPLLGRIPFCRLCQHCPRASHFATARKDPLISGRIHTLIFERLQRTLARSLS